MRKLRTEQKDRQQENSRPRDERNGGGANIAGTYDKADAAGEKGKTNEVDAEELKKRRKRFSPVIRRKWYSAAGGLPKPHTKR